MTKHRSAVLLLIVLALALGVAVWLGRRNGPIVLPLDDADVRSVVAEVFNIGGGIEDIPPTNIPAEYQSKILNALRPVVVTKDATKYLATPVGKLLIEKHDGTVIEVLVPWSEHSPLCFTFNGVECVRGGAYKPINDVLYKRTGLGWCDESIKLAVAIREISREVQDGKQSELLAEALADLERSAGRLPPR